jgi:hypothetical protein
MNQQTLDRSAREFPASEQAAVLETLNEAV